MYSHMIPFLHRNTHRHIPSPCQPGPGCLSLLGYQYLSPGLLSGRGERDGVGRRLCSHITPQPAPLRASLVIAVTINEMFLVVTL